MRAMSIIELLTAIAIISLTASFLTPSLSGIMGGRDLSRALDVVSNTATVARQTAMTRGSPIALVVAQSSRAKQDDTQAVMLLSAPTGPSTVWTPVGAWAKLPQSIQLDVFSRNGAKSFFNVGQGPLTSALPVKLNGQSVTAYDYIVFYPDGSVSAPADGPALTFRLLQKKDEPAAYTLVVQSNSGRTRIIQ